jgi:hypothetical protein
MRPLTKVGIVLATTLAFGILAFGGWLWVLGGPERHADGQGALASFGDSGNSVTESLVRSGSLVWTFGIPICLWQGTDPAILDGTVRGTVVTGDGWQFLGARVREFAPNSGIGIGSVGGWPPTVPDVLHQAQGFAVTHPCHIRNGDPSAIGTELDFGVRDPGTNGGGWMGLEIGYTARGHHHILSTPWNILVCGPAVGPEHCPTT